MKENITSILENCEAFKSLQLESQIKIELNNRDWECLRSPYFQDRESKKYREIDILARRYYITRINNIDWSFILKLIVESKSLSGYHIIFDGLETKWNNENNYNIWMGSDNYHQNIRLSSMLQKINLSDREKKGIIDFFDHRCFYEDMQTCHKYIPQPFQEINRYTTFRETKINTTKELDNSVLWKTFQSLQSSCKGCEDARWDFIEDELFLRLKEIVDNNKDLLSSLDDSVGSLATIHISLHKIAVVDANLWESQNGKIKELKYGRLVQSELSGGSMNWIDVVNCNHLKEYVDKISDHYQSFYDHLPVANMTKCFMR